MTKLQTISFIVGAITCLLISVTTVTAETRLVTHWYPQAQFAGYYVALEKGFYKDRGVDLKILSGGAEHVPAERLISGEAHFATMFLAAAIERKMAGAPLVNISQTIQRSALLILTKTNSNIDSIKDLEGKKIATWSTDFQIQPWALFKYHKIEVETVPFSGSMELFLRDAVPATLAMWYNGYHTVLSAGYKDEELQPIFFKDTPFDFPEDGLYCLPNTITKNPDLVRNIVDATSEGWEYAFANKAETLDILEQVMIAEQIPFSRGHQQWMLTTMENIMKPKTDMASYGHLSEESFKNVMTTILDTGFSDQRIDYNDFVWSGE